MFEGNSPNILFCYSPWDPCSTPSRVPPPSTPALSSSRDPHLGQNYTPLCCPLRSSDISTPRSSRWSRLETPSKCWIRGGGANAIHAFRRVKSVHAARKTSTRSETPLVIEEAVIDVPVVVTALHLLLAEANAASSAPYTWLTTQVETYTLCIESCFGSGDVAYLLC